MEEKKVIARTQTTSVKGLDFLIISIISLIFLLCPLFFTGLVAQNVGFEKIILFYFLVLIATVAWVTKGVIVGELNFKRTPLDWPILGLLVIFIISTILSVSQKESLIGIYGNPSKSLVAIIIYVLFYYLLVNNLNLKRIKILFWSLVISTTLIIVYSVLQLLGIFVLPIAATKTISFNPLGSLTALTMYLIITLPLLVIAVAQIREIHPDLRNKLWLGLIKVIVSLLIFASLFILTLLNGFTFWPAAIVGIVIVLMFFLSKIIRITSSNLIIPIVTFSLLIILLVLGNFNILSLKLPVEVSLSRSASWSVAKDTVVSHPLFGTGVATFDYDFIKYKGTDFNASPLWNARFDSASGIIFELLATTGGLGALTAIIVALIALSICFLALIKAGRNGIQSILLGLFSGFITLIIFSALFTLNVASVLIGVIIAIFTLCTSIIVYPERFKTMTLSFRTSPKYALALAAIFLTVSAGVVILFTMGIKMYLADIFVHRAAIAVSLDDKINYLAKAVQLNPYQDSYYIDLATNYMAKANAEANGAKNQSVIENALTLAIDNGKIAVQISPNSVTDNEALALVYENASFYVRGALEWAESLYNTVIKLDPSSPTPYLRLALINMARANAATDQTEQAGYIDEAIKYYDQALAKKSDFSDAYYGKAIADEKLNKLDDAIEQMKQAVLSTTNNVDYSFELGRLLYNRGVNQPSLAQNATTDITTGQANPDNLSVDTSGGTRILKMNNDLTSAEQIFLGILQANPGHANALYSLALIYQVTGQNDKARVVVRSLLNLLTDEAQKDIVRKQFVGLY